MSTFTLTDLTALSISDLEHAFISCVFSAPEEALIAAGWLKPDQFIDQRLRRFWDLFTGKHRGDVMSSALDCDLMADITLWLADYSDYNVYRSMGPLAEQMVNRGYLMSIDKSLAAMIAARRRNDVDEIKRLVSEIGSTQPNMEDHIPDASSLHLDFTEYITRDKIQTIQTHITGLDRALKGIALDELVLIASRPSMGKTTLAFQIARNLAKSGKSVIYFSLEMKARDLWAKAACGRAGVDWYDVLNKKLDPDQMDQLIQISAGLAGEYDNYLMIDDSTYHTTESIGRIMARKKPNLVIIDVLARLKNKMSKSKIDWIEEIAYSLKDMAKNNNIPIMALHHLNRAAEQALGNEGKPEKPMMKNLSDSSGLEKAADTIGLIYSPGYYDTGKPPAELETQIIIAKHRMGGRNMIADLRYLTKEQWFESKNP
ncbi:replicative DNA helicase [Gammaproteobacteria bacterium]